MTLQEEARAVSRAGRRFLWPQRELDRASWLCFFLRVLVTLPSGSV